MKTIYIFLLFIFLFTAHSGVTYSQDRGATTQTENEYVVLSTEKFAEIEAKMNLQDDWNPIRIEGYSKAELVAFYIQSYSDETIAIWADFAYKKIHSFEDTVPSDDQKITLKKILELPKTAENAHRFMMNMTIEQIEAVGY